MFIGPESETLSKLLRELEGPNGCEGYKHLAALRPVQIRLRFPPRHIYPMLNGHF